MPSLEEGIPLLATEDNEQHPTRKRRGVWVASATLVFLAFAFLSSHDSGKSVEELTHTEDSLEISATNVYGSTNGNTFYYPFLRGRDDPTSALLVEPHRDTTLAVDDSSDTCTYTWIFEKGEPVSQTGNPIVVNLGETGEQTVTVTETSTETGETLRSREFRVFVKYVRREVRKLTEEDRRDFVDAASTLWKVSTVEGRKLYGDRYYDINYLTIVHNDLAGNQHCDFIHGTDGYAFVNAHTALNMMLEQSMQAVNPRVSLPYWSYVHDSTLFHPTMAYEGSKGLLDIWQSPVFSAKYFGSSDEETGVIKDGAWAHTKAPVLTKELVLEAGFDAIDGGAGHFVEHGVASCHGQSLTETFCGLNDAHALEEAEASTQHQRNSFGLLRSPWNMHADGAIIRSRKNCGVVNSDQFPSCEAVHSAQNGFTSFQEYVVNLQVSPHGTVHVFTGGAFGKCSETFSALKATLEDAGVDSSVTTGIMNKVSDLQKNLWMDGQKTCPSVDECGVGETDQDACVCSCPALDEAFESMSADEIRSSDLWSGISAILRSDISDDEWAALSADQLLAVAKAACDTDVLTGDMLGSNSPLDMLFYSTHAEVERMFQRKLMSGTMTDMTWPEGECPGESKEWKNLWFDYAFDSSDDAAAPDSTQLTNEEFLEVLDPKSDKFRANMKYVYDDFSWGICSIYSARPYPEDGSLMDEWMWSNDAATEEAEATSAAFSSSSSSSTVTTTWTTTTDETTCDDPSAGPVLGGVDVVSLAEGVVPTVGLSSITYTTTQGGYEFYFASEENRALFEANPGKYAPSLGGFCGWALTGLDQMASSSSGSLWYADVGDADAHEFHYDGSGATFFMNSGVRSNMDACGSTCWDQALANFEAIAAAKGYSGHCYNTQHVAGLTASGTLLLDSAAAAEAAGKEGDSKSTASSKAASTTTTTSTTSGSKQPHIVLVTLDDVGWNDIGYQSSDLKGATPFMDVLAEKSVKLTKYYTQPSCTPSRVTLMTGKFAYKNGFQNYELQPGDSVGVPLSNEMLPARLRKLGYKTRGLGKWNIGHCSEDYMPHSRGFDHFLGYFCPGHGYSNHDCDDGDAKKHDLFEGWNDYSSTSSSSSSSSSEGRRWVPATEYKGTYDTLLYRDRSVLVVSEHAHEFGNDTPLFLWVAMHGIHAQSDSGPEPPEELLTEENHRVLEELKGKMALTSSSSSSSERFFARRYVTATVLMSLDNSVKALYKELDASGMLHNTVLVVNSDNGASVAFNEGMPGNNYPLRSEKFSYFEGGVRVPAFVFAPGHLPSHLQQGGASFDGMVHHVDLLTTFVGLAGGSVEESDDLDGIDFWPALKGEEGAATRTELVLNLPRNSDWKLGESDTSQGIAIYADGYKLVTNHAIDRWYEPEPFHGSEPAGTCVYDFFETSSDAMCTYANFLFHLEADPHERVNLWQSAKHAAVKAKLLAKAEALTAAQGEYGRLVAEFANQGGENTKEGTADHDYVGSWNCAVLK